MGIIVCNLWPMDDRLFSDAGVLSMRCDNLLISHGVKCRAEMCQLVRLVNELADSCSCRHTERDKAAVTIDSDDNGMVRCPGYRWRPANSWNNVDD